VKIPPTSANPENAERIESANDEARPLSLSRSFLKPSITFWTTFFWASITFCAPVVIPS
jgi:hypothetical protein